MLFLGGLRPRLACFLLRQQELSTRTRVVSKPCVQALPLACSSRVYSSSSREDQNSSTSSSSSTNSRDDDGEFRYSANLWERKQLAKGYFFEVDEVRDTGGKLFECTRGLIPSKRAVDFPQLVATRPENKGEVKLLDALRETDTTQNNKNTLMGVYFRENAKSQLKSWTEGYLEKHGLDADLQVVELSCVDSFLFRAGPLKSMLLRGLHTQAKDQIQYFAAFGTLPEFRQRLDIQNRLSAFCFLLDGEQRVRWRGCGEASGEELEKLRQAVMALSA